MIRISNPADLIIVNRKNQILLAKRKEGEAGYGKWSIPGGGAEACENFEDALHREIKEELGCGIKWFKYFSSYIEKEAGGHIVRAVYFYGEITGELKLNSELSEYKWWDIGGSEMLKLEFAFNQKEVVTDFVKFWKSLK